MFKVYVYSARTIVTPEQYLEIERKAGHKTGYYQGEMFAMSGARRQHNVVSSNTLREFSRQLRSTRCEVYASDMRDTLQPRVCILTRI